MAKSSGQVGFEAYNASTGGKTFDGRDIPPWDVVAAEKPHVAKAWEDAADAIEHATFDHMRDMLEARRAAGGFGFDSALVALKNGKKVARAGWNGKSMWIALTPGGLIPVGAARPGAAGHLATEAIAGSKDLHEAETKTIRIMGHIDMRAADGSLVIGWLASQTDLLADDWSIVE